MFDRQPQPQRWADEPGAGTPSTLKANWKEEIKSEDRRGVQKGCGINVQPTAY